MSSTSREQYGALGSDVERRSYLAQFLLDPEIANANGFNKTYAFDRTSKDAAKHWWTREQLGGPLGLNNMAHADMLIASKSLPEQPHEQAALADAGVLQYYWVIKSDHETTGHAEEAGTSADVELKANEYNEVKGPSGVVLRSTNCSQAQDDADEERRDA